MLRRTLLAAGLLLIFLNCSLVIAKKKMSGGKCQMCQSFVESFHSGLKDTENSNFAGGDTSWEEKNQPVYANSEVRLIEILESVCGSSDYECTRFLDRHEEDIERWWLKLRRNGHEDFEKWLCFENLKVCCPKGTYGPDCAECPGGAESPCSGHGTCQGSGEVDGAGTCRCDSGYKGKLCDACKDGYYNENGTCNSCDGSCKKTCTGPGSANCDECAKGFVREDPVREGGEEEDVKGECEDIDECEEEIAKCKVGTYCHNTPGSYECKDCDPSCKDECSARGPSGCLECADGYEDKSGYCMDINECTDGKASCADGKYCDNTRGSYECKDCDESCMLTCTKAGPSGCDVCKEGYTMQKDACEDLDECSSYPPPCDEKSEFCSNVKGSYACKCKGGYTRVEGKCVSWDEADELRNKNSEKKSKKKKKKSGKKQPVVVEEDEQDQITTNTETTAPPAAESEDNLESVVEELSSDQPESKSQTTEHEEL